MVKPQFRSQQWRYMYNRSLCLKLLLLGWSIKKNFLQYKIDEDSHIHLKIWMICYLTLISSNTRFRKRTCVDYTYDFCKKRYYEEKRFNWTEKRFWHSPTV